MAVSSESLGRRLMRQAGAWTTMLTLAVSAASAAPAQTPAGERENLYAQAAAREQVPLEVLVAIAGAESSFHPWALNIDGHEVYCHSREEAEQRLRNDDHVAIGLMQINWRYWGPRLRLSKQELLDPETNLIYGARILKAGLAGGGSLWFRISSYHSGTLAQRDKYNQLVYHNYRRYLAGEASAASSVALRDMRQSGAVKAPIRDAPVSSSRTLWAGAKRRESEREAISPKQESAPQDGLSKREGSAASFSDGSLAPASGAR